MIMTRFSVIGIVTPVCFQVRVLDPKTQQQTTARPILGYEYLVEKQRSYSRLTNSVQLM